MGARAKRGSDRDDGRCNERTLLYVFCWRGRNGEQFPGGSGCDRSTRLIQFSIHRPGKPLLVHAQGGRQGEQNAAYPVRPCHETPGDSDDRSLLSRSPRAKRTCFPNSPRPASQRVGSSGDHRHGCRKPLSGQEYNPSFNAEFMQRSLEEGSAFVPWIGVNLDDILCQQEERTVSADNCVSVDCYKLQIPANQYRCHYVRVRVMVHRYRDGSLAIFHGPLKLADYDRHGKLVEAKPRKAA